MESSDASWERDPFQLVLCVEDGCTRAVTGKSSQEYRCGKHENEYQAWLDDVASGAESPLVSRAKIHAAEMLKRQLGAQRDGQLDPCTQMPEIWYE